MFQSVVMRKRPVWDLRSEENSKVADKLRNCGKQKVFMLEFRVMAVHGVLKHRQTRVAEKMHFFRLPSGQSEQDR